MMLLYVTWGLLMLAVMLAFFVLLR